MQSAERKLNPALHEDPFLPCDYPGTYSKEKALLSGARYHKTSSCDQHQNKLSLFVSLNEAGLSGWKKELHSLSQTQRERRAMREAQTEPQGAVPGGPTSTLSRIRVLQKHRNLDQSRPLESNFFSSSSLPHSLPQKCHSK